MPRYHFHLRDGVSHEDKEGVELPDAAAAERESARVLSQFVQDHYAQIFADGNCEVMVADADGLVLFALTVVVRDAPARGGPWSAPPA
jgi:hypothetical protein